ncbi:Uncharacterised protein [Mycolicibacterium vanbaalenii]|uniref:Aminoglycoside phosphotransferase domain-containing protein n=1 Tax=Mycolicibacterium vanbaalenii TaxID=110539 RepID=A0A5S9QYV2_MYCVN|nr:Uncharacterised protein [Mycolicibacterium vanbaalenii]
MDVHPEQLLISELTVQTLVSTQFPQWRHAEVRPIKSPGTVNAIFRIGDHLVARFPLELDDVAVVRERLEVEVAAASELLGRSPFATPEPIALGAAGCGYPLPWSIYSWLPGQMATADNVSESVSFALDLASFIEAVRAIDTDGRTFDGNGRGGDILAHDDWMQQCLTNSEGLLDVGPLRALWAEMREIPRGPDPAAMNHADLIPPNILIDGEHIVGVLDVGGLRAADPALDLVGAWHLLNARGRAILRERLDCDDAQWQRGRAWAFQQAMGAVWYYVESSPTMSAGCQRTLQRIVTDI